MRKIAFWLILSLLMIFMLSLTAGLAMAELDPFHPGDALFPLQTNAEQILVSLTPDPTARAETLLDLLDRRTGDLERTSVSPLAQAEFDRTFAEVRQALAGAPEKNSADLRTRALAVFTRTRETLLRLAGAHSDQAGMLVDRRMVVELDIQILTDLAHPLSDLGAQPAGTQSAGSQVGAPANAALDLAAIDASTVDPRVVTFQSGSGGAKHDFFPLTGKHATIECTACHTNGQFAGTPTTCTACHVDKVPANHFPGECSLCHTSDAWKPARFDHPTALAADCTTCHQVDKPANHFAGQCSLCHSTDAWKPANFDHAIAKASDCLSCHLPNKPANHFDGQCSLCHTTVAWKPATFNHAALKATDCQSCHSGQ